jgi:hypothetical protein
VSSTKAANLDSLKFWDLSISHWALTVRCHGGDGVIPTVSALTRATSPRVRGDRGSLAAHPSGDEVLKQFVARAQAQLRPTDFQARYGGEEFLIGLSHTALDEGVVVAERIRGLVEERPFPRQYGRTGLTYCTVVGCSRWEQSHMQKEAGHGEGYYLRGAR